MTQEDSEEFGLVYPLVVCQSNGGRYEDRAYVAGVEFGAVDQRMGSGEPVIDQYVHADNVEQIDLAAMHHGYSLRTEPWDEHPDEWAHIRLTKIVGGEAGGA